MNTPRNSSTQTPMRTRGFCAGSPIHCRKATRSATASSYSRCVSVPGVTCSKPLEAMLDLRRVVRVLLLDELGRALALQLPQHVRHADVGEGQVVPAGRPWCRRGRRCAGRCRGSRRRCPCPVPARERAITDRSGGTAPNQSLACFGSSDDLHRVADLVGRRTAGCSLICVVGQADVAQAVVAHVGRRVAVQAVVDEELGAVLQRRHVGQLLDRELVPGQAAFGSLARRQRARHSEQDDGLRSFFIMVVGSRSVGRETSRARAPA